MTWSLNILNYRANWPTPVVWSNLLLCCTIQPYSCVVWSNCPLVLYDPTSLLYCMIQPSSCVVWYNLLLCCMIQTPPVLYYPTLPCLVWSNPLLCCMIQLSLMCCIIHPSTCVVRSNPTPKLYDPPFACVVWSKPSCIVWSNPELSTCQTRDL